MRENCLPWFVRHSCSRAALQSTPVFEQPTPQRITPIANRESKSQREENCQSATGPNAVKHTPTDSTTPNSTDHYAAPEMRPEMTTVLVTVTFHNCRDKTAQVDCF